jgi:hypothetical protein
VKPLKFATFILIGLVLSCSSPKKQDEKVPTIPSQYLGIQEMSDILIDIHLAEGYVQEYRLKGNRSREVLDSLYTAVFTIHEMPFDSFMLSYKFYQQDARLLEHLYFQVKEKLARLEGQLVN